VSDPDPALNGALSERLCALAHELNNGLAVIAGQCELLADHAELDPECTKGVRLIMDVVHRLAIKINGHECRFVARENPIQTRWSYYGRDTHENDPGRFRS
jgi:signal transduction histidine kinase